MFTKIEQKKSDKTRPYILIIIIKQGLIIFKLFLTKKFNYPSKIKRF